MKLTLNGWQRLWVVLSFLLLIVTVGVVWAFLPSVDTDILVDLKSPDSQYLRTMPEGFRLDKQPEPGQPCYALAMLKHQTTARIISIEDYRAFIRSQQILTLLSGLGLWLFAVVVLYASGWSIGWVRAGFRSKETIEQTDRQVFSKSAPSASSEKPSS